jgi:hypothetical protein
MRNRVLATFALVLFTSSGALADVRTEQKTQVQFGGMLGRVINLFGGKAAREGVTSTVLVKGDRKVTTSNNTSQIIDLAEERVYDLDLRRRTFKVTTFADMRRRMEEAQRKAQEDARAQQDREAPEAAPGDEKEVEVDFEVKSTGEAKTINGFETKQSLVIITVREKGKTLDESGGLVLTADLWLAPEQPALAEVADFDRRYAEKLYGGLVGVSADQMAMVLAMYPMLRQAMDRMNAEGGQVEGTAILSTMTFDAVRSAEQARTEAKEEAQPATGRGLGGMLGGLARRARRSEPEEPKQRATFLTSTVEVLKLSTDVPADAVAVPTGFKETK